MRAEPKQELTRELMPKRLRQLLPLAAVVALLGGLLAPLAAQDNAAEPLLGGVKASARPKRIEFKPSEPPAISIPVEPLGYAAPGLFYLGQRESFAFLGFLDENHLLFCFRVPGLLRRDEVGGEAGGNGAPLTAAGSEPRQFRAVVLDLPSGSVQAEALWTLHGWTRSLWVLPGGRFLLRDGNNLELGDATLEPKPFLRFPGPLLSLEMDPTQQFLVTVSREPAAAEPASAPSAESQDFSLQMQDRNAAGQGREGQSTAGTDAGQAASATPPQPDLVVRILNRDSGKVLLVSRALAAVHLPIDADGYLESLGNGAGRWQLRLTYFSGGSTILGQVDSSCPPRLDFIAPEVFLATTCDLSGAGKLVMMTTGGDRLWQKDTSASEIWPLLTAAPDGSRLAREVLAVDAPVNADTTLSQDDILGQRVEVIDSADGKVVLTAAANPILDAGGNVAFSPSGRRMAIVNAGQIQLFELPPAPPLPDQANTAGR